MEDQRDASKTAQSAVQLYTLRDYTGTEREFISALEKCRDIGYVAVQLSAVGCMNGDSAEVDFARARAILDEIGLSCAATHRPWKALLEDPDKEVDNHMELGCDYVAIGGIWDYGYTPESYRRFLREAESVVPKLLNHGIRFGYHNHSHEFIRNPETGKPCFDILVEEGGPDLMLEIDTYWVAHAGMDAAKLLRRCKGRIPVVHLKDKEVVAGDGPVMAAVGEGNLDWNEILSACDEGGTAWLVVEQDTCRRDPFDCLRSSYEFLRSRGYR